MRLRLLLLLLVLSFSACSGPKRNNPFNRPADPYFQQTYLKQVPPVVVIPFKDENQMGYGLRVSSRLYRGLIASGNFIVLDEHMVQKRVTKLKGRSDAFLTPEEISTFAKDTKAGMVITARLTKLDFSRSHRNYILAGTSTKFKVYAELEVQAVDVRSGLFRLSTVINQENVERKWKTRLFNLRLEGDFESFTSVEKERLIQRTLDDLADQLQRRIVMALRGPQVY